jgi:hypothetical protein
MDKPNVSVSPAELAPVRDYFQDVAKVVSKFQQAFVDILPHDAQYGLLVVPEGLASQSLTINGKTYQVIIDMRQGFLRLDDQKWPLQNYSPERLIQELRQWTVRQDLDVAIDDPAEYITGQSQYDQAIASDIADIFGWSAMLFEAMKPGLSGDCSPVLLFPHHFDVSMSWFPSEKLQYTLGFLFGDETIPEPYLYVTAYPEPAEFTNLSLASPAYWQVNGFSGAILKCGDVAHLPDPTGTAGAFLHAVLRLP